MLLQYDPDFLDNFPTHVDHVWHLSEGIEDPTLVPIHGLKVRVISAIRGGQTRHRSARTGRGSIVYYWLLGVDAQARCSQRFTGYVLKRRRCSSKPLGLLLLCLPNRCHALQPVQLPPFPGAAGGDGREDWRRSTEQIWTVDHCLKQDDGNLNDCGRQAHFCRHEWLYIVFKN